MKGLPEGTEFIGKAQDETLPVGGELPERKHVRGNHVALQGADTEVPGGILNGDLGMREGMQTRVRLMPVVKIVIMEEGAPHERSFVCLDMQGGGDAEAHHRNGKRMRVGRRRSVLHELFFGLHPLRSENIRPVPFHHRHIIWFSTVFLRHTTLFYTRLSPKSTMKFERDRMLDV